MDTNGTFFHLLLGRDDWNRCLCAESDAAPAQQWLAPADPGAPLEWSDDDCELLLRRRPFRFRPAPLDTAPDLERDRRGAAVDMFGNWYWVDGTRSRIRVHSAGSGAASDFWPGQEPPAAPAPGGFIPLEAAAPPAAISLGGLAVTADHHLVAGTLSPRGLLVFDLFAGGPPQQLLWPAGVDFAPFDLAAGPDCGLWILDRRNRRYWALDRHFGVVRTLDAAILQEEADQTFQPLAGGSGRKVFRRSFPRGIDVGAASAIPAEDPCAIEVLADATVLILDRPSPGGGAFSSVLVCRDGALIQRLSLEPMRAHVEAGPAQPFSLIGHDMAVVAAEKKGDPGTLFVADAGGNQAYAFRLARDQKGIWSLTPLPDYLPMRRFGGKALVAGAGMARYDFGEAWVPLARQPRPRHRSQAFLLTPDLDGKEPDCIWHRLLLDACIPAETRVQVWSRAANERELLDAVPWTQEPPLYLRGDGAELPFHRSPWGSAPGARARGDGTWELLLQRAQGRHLQLKLRLSGPERGTPRLRSLRVYYPRFSYLAQYLPAVYREDRPSAQFLDGFLANVEGIFTAVEDRIAAAQILFDWRSAPAEALEWLARWLGVALDPAWDEQRRRLFIRHALLFFQYRGTAHGLRLVLAVALDKAIDPSRFAAPERVREERFGVRIVEKYLTRRFPDVLFGDPAQLEVPVGLENTVPWRTADGGAALRRRYGRFLGLAENAAPPAFPLVPPADHEEAGRWSSFCEQTLGFTPWAAALEREAWQLSLEARYGNLDALGEAWGLAWESFGAIPQPANQPENAAIAGDWARHMREPRPPRTPRERLEWQSFLRSRYGVISRLNALYATAWAAFDLVPLPDRLPPDGPALEDWFQFEGAVLAMRGAAHRFSVLLPMPTGLDIEPEEPRRRLELARRIVALEKPAHTTFDVRFYWAMFRVGEARLGRDTLIDRGTREQLIPALVLGRGYVGEGYVAPTAIESRSDRTILGRDRLDH